MPTFQESVALRYGCKFGAEQGYPADDPSYAPDHGDPSVVDWSAVDITDLESVRKNLPACEVRAQLEAALMLKERQDMLIHALVGMSGSDLIEQLKGLEGYENLALLDTVSPSIMSYLNDIARANRGIGIRMDHQDAFSRAVSDAVQGGGPVDYRQAAKASGDYEAARQTASGEDSAYLTGGQN